MTAQRDPVREWCEQYAQRWLNIGFEPVSDAPFRASVKPIFKDLRIARVSFSPGFTFRDKKLVEDGDDVFTVFISQSSIIEIEQHTGRDLQLGHGDTTVLDYCATGRIGSRLGMERVGILVPRLELMARGARPENAVMQHLPRRLEGLQLLRGYLRFLERTHFGDSLCETIRRHLIDLVALAVMPHVAIGESGLTAVVAARRSAALDYIAAHYQDPELSLETVAHRQGISPRYLQRVLETSGTSFVDHVNELRLQKAFVLLAESRDCSRRISDIALQVGFSDISHFNRLFRLRFADTPSAVRAQRRGEQ